MSGKIGNKTDNSNRVFLKITKRPFLSSSIVYGVMMAAIAVIGIAGKDRGEK